MRSHSITSITSITSNSKPTSQITVRGVDARTKQLLQQQAAQKGTSMNALVLESLRHEAGTDTAEERYRAMKATIKKYRISSGMNVQLVFDTTALTRLLDEDETMLRVVNAEEYNGHTNQRLIPLATDAEIRFGFNNGSRREQNEQKYQLLFEAFGLTLLLPDQDTAYIYADLAAWCKQHGFAPSNNDLWIAAANVQHGAELLTLDRDFSHLPQLRLVKL